MTRRRSLASLAFTAVLLLSACNSQESTPPRPVRGRPTVLLAPRDTLRDAVNVITYIGADSTPFRSRFRAARDRDARGRLQLRFSGPWFSGSTLGEIQVSITGTMANPSATWYYAGFFPSVLEENPTDIVHYGKYIQDAAERTERPPVLNARPGQVPTGSAAGGIKEMRFYLAGIFARSKYGGSLELRFQSVDDFQYEVATLDTRWDIGSLTMSVFVTPIKDLMNPLEPPLSGFERLNVEFDATGVVAYTAAGNPKADPELASLYSLFATMSERLEPLSSGMNRDANQFAHAWLHVQQQDNFSQETREIVSAIELADDHVVLRTRSPVVHFAWSVRYQRTDRINAYPLLRFGMSPYWGWGQINEDDFWETGFRYESVLPNQSSPWIRLKTFNLEECPGLNHFVFIHARDYFWQTLHQEFIGPLDAGAGGGTLVLTSDLQPNCDQISAFANDPTAVQGAPADAPDRVMFEIREQEILLKTCIDVLNQSCIPGATVGSYHLFLRLQILFL